VTASGARAERARTAGTERTRRAINCASPADRKPKIMGLYRLPLVASQERKFVDRNQLRLRYGAGIRAAMAGFSDHTCYKMVQLSCRRTRRWRATAPLCPFGSNDRSAVGHLVRRQCAAQIGRWIAFGPPGRNGVAKYHPVRRLPGPPPRLVPIDFTVSEDGLPPDDFGLENALACRTGRPAPTRSKGVSGQVAQKPPEGDPREA
jgi:hypothetical protein